MASGDIDDAETPCAERDTGCRIVVHAFIVRAAMDQRCGHQLHEPWRITPGCDTDAAHQAGP